MAFNPRSRVRKRQLRGAQNRNSAAPERSTYMPSADIDREILDQFRRLSRPQQENVIASLALFLIGQAETPSDPAIIGE